MKSTIIGNRTLITNTYKHENLGGVSLSNVPTMLMSSQYGNGHNVSYSYDEYGRLMSKSYSDLTRYAYTYDSEGRLSILYDYPRNKNYHYYYDNPGRIKSVVCSDKTIRNYSYNSVGNLSKTSYGFNNTNYTADYTYHPGGYFKKAIFKNNGNQSSSIEYAYDYLNRVTRQTATVGSTSWYTAYTYYEPYQGAASPLIRSIGNQNIGNYFYSYDAYGNITSITESGTLKVTYTYDYLGELTRENNLYTNKTVTYQYDNGGNIVSKTIYPYTTGSLDGLTGTVVQYTYGDSQWKDLLTAYNGNAITYDAIGNPLNYHNGTRFAWRNGRQLATATTASGTTASYRYNDEGIRTAKIVGDVTTAYFLEGDRILGSYSSGGNGGWCWFEYDATGRRHSINIGGMVFYYYYNAQGDVMGLRNTSGQSVVQYTYDSWGKLLSTTGTMAGFINPYNPFRYRGYFYDEETGLYYLNSRYYDPETGRFLNADGQLNTDDILGCNMFAYCGNNPVNRVDPTGEAWWHWAIGAVVVVACAAAVVVTAGGAAAAVAAVGAVSSGVAAATTASTIAAGAFIGASVAYGSTAFMAAANSKSTKEFADKGNWGTVLSPVAGGLIGAGGAYIDSKIVSSKSNSKLDKYVKNPPKIKNVSPANIEKIAIKENLNVGTLTKGSHAGQGLKVTWGGDKLIQYHPGGGHHGPISYWKVSSGENGTIRIFNDK